MRNLEVEFQPALQNARIARRGYRVIQRGGEVRRAAANRVRVVEGVKCFETELPVETLGELYVFEQGEVGSPETWPANSTGPLGCFRRLSCAGRRKCRCVEPTAEGMRSSGVGIAHLIRTAAKRRRAEEAARTKNPPLSTNMIDPLFELRFRNRDTAFAHTRVFMPHPRKNCRC